MKDECIICMEMLHLATFGCKHKCCISCANKIHRCPLCRTKILEITHPLSTSKPAIRKPFQEITPSPAISVKGNIVEYEGKRIPVADNWELNYVIANDNTLYMVTTHKDTNQQIFGYLHMDSKVYVINPEKMHMWGTKFHDVEIVILDMNKKHILLNVIHSTTQICFTITHTLLTAEAKYHSGMKFHFTSDGSIVMWAPLKTMASTSEYRIWRGDRWLSYPLIAQYAEKYEYVDSYAHYVDPVTNKETYLPITLSGGGIKHIIPDLTFTVVYDGSTWPFSMNSLDTIDDLKNNIKLAFGIEPHYQQLVRNTSRLMKLSEIRDDDIIYLWHIEKLPQIFIQMPHGHSKVVNILPCDTVWTLKHIIMQKTGIPCAKQAYTFEGKRLINDLLLADYCIRNGSTLYLHTH